MKVKKGVILTAGEGKRMLPLTIAMPKALLPIGMKTAVQTITEEMIGAGVEEIAFVVASDSPVRRYMEFLAKTEFKNARFTFIEQSEPRGSGHALYVAKGFCEKESFLLANCDDLFEYNACKVLIETGGNCVGLTAVSAKDCDKYGVACVRNGFLMKTEEKPKKHAGVSPLVLAGRYLLDGDIFDCLALTGYVDGELRLTDALNLLCTERDVAAAEIKGRRFDTGCAEGYKKAFICIGCGKKVDTDERLY